MFERKKILFVKNKFPGQVLNNKYDIYKIKKFIVVVVDSNEKVRGSGKCQSVPIWLGPRRSRFVSLSILLSSLILCISVSAPVMQNE
jgi:hypothetical protein